MRRAGAWALVFFLVALPAAAFPDRPLRAIVPFGPGGSTDILMRALGELLARDLGHPVVVMNKPGAGSAIGAIEVMNSRPDGHSFGMLTVTGLAFVPHTRTVPYAANRFDYICQVYEAPTLLLVAPNSPIRSVADLLAEARRAPDALLCGSPGLGSLNHVAMAGFLSANDVGGTHVPYTTGSAMYPALLAGDISVIADSILTTRTFGLRPLAVFGSARLSNLPDVPTIAEFGRGFDATIWGGLVAPAGLAPNVRARLERACERAVGSDQFRDTAERFATHARYRNGAAFRDYVAQESERYGEFISLIGMARQP